MALVSQENVLFAMSLRENIRLGNLDASDQEVEAVAKLAQAHPFIVRLPDGYDTQVGERGVTLSQGQRQRIAIARAALAGAPILLLDEPTTGLDEENRTAVVSALRDLYQQSTVFLVTHDLLYAAQADWVVHVEQGHVHEQGTHEELMRLDKSYAQMYRLQLESRGGSDVVEQESPYAV